MREYEHEASDVASQDVGCAWLMVGVVWSCCLWFWRLAPR
jgi:diacylglycerol kinase